MLGRVGTGVALLLMGAMGVACTGQAGGNVTIRPGTVKPGTNTKPSSPSTALAGLHVQVLAPSSLAAGGGVIQGSDVAALATARGVGIVAAGGGNIIAAGGGNIVAAGGGNIVAGGAGNYHLAAAPSFRLATNISRLSPVAHALVFLEDMGGKLVGSTAVESTANGSVVIPQQFKDVPMLAVARFKVNGTTYQLSCPVATSALPTGAAYAIDPINTIVQGRIRQILNQNGAGAAITPEELKAVWSVFNDADVEVALDALKDGATLSDLNAVYDQLIGNVKDAAQAKIVKDYMRELRDIATRRGDASATASPTPAPSPSPDGNATATPGASSAASPDPGATASVAACAAASSDPTVNKKEIR